MNRAYLIVYMLCAPHIFFAQSNSRNLHQDTWASYLGYAGHHDKAQRWYQHILAHGGSWFSFKGYISVLEKKKRYKEIVEIINKEIEATQPDGSPIKKTLDSLFAKDPEVQFIFAQSLAHTGKLKEAQDRFIKLSQEFKKNPEIMLHAIEAYMQQKDFDKAITTIDTFLNNTPKKPTHFVFYFLKAQLLMQLNKYKDALGWAKKSVKPNPHFAQGWLLKAIIEEQLGLTHDAIDSYHNFLKTSGIYNSQILKHLFELEQKQKKQSLNRDLPILNRLYALLKNNQEQLLLKKLHIYLDQLTINEPRTWVENRDLQPILSDGTPKTSLSTIGNRVGALRKNSGQHLTTRCIA